MQIGSLERTGLDEVLADRLAESMTALELRRWCRRHGIVRERGDSKRETALKAVKQNPIAVTKAVLPNREDSNGDSRVPEGLKGAL